MGVVATAHLALAPELPPPSSVGAPTFKVPLPLVNKKRKLLESSEERGDFAERGAAFEGAPVEVLAPVGCSEVIPGPFLPVPPALIEGFRIQDPLFTRASL